MHPVAQDVLPLPKPATKTSPKATEPAKTEPVNPFDLLDQDEESPRNEEAASITEDSITEEVAVVPVQEVVTKVPEPLPQPEPREPSPVESKPKEEARLILQNRTLEDGCAAPVAQPVLELRPNTSWVQRAVEPKPTVMNPLLAHKWVFWEHRGMPKGGGLGSAYHHAIGYVGECATVGDFWNVFNNIPAPSEFFCSPADHRARSMVGGRLVEGWSLFRHGVQAEWEDPQNCTGAEFTISTDQLDQCDEWWEATLLAMIGNVLPFAGELTGVRMIDKCRKGSKAVYRLELWFTEAANANEVKLGLAEVLGESAGKFKLKQHSTQKEVKAAAAKISPEQQVDSYSRVKDIRALLAKLTPDRFERLAPQLRALLGAGSPEGVAAVAQCIKQCTMQTPIFHGMYAKLVQALAPVPGVATAVVQDCLQQLQQRSEDTRHDCKHAASFAAELCALRIINNDEMLQVARNFESDNHVDVEIQCTLLTKLKPIKVLGAKLAGIGQELSVMAQNASLPARLRFMVQDVIKLLRA